MPVLSSSIRWPTPLLYPNNITIKQGTTDIIMWEPYPDSYYWPEKYKWVELSVKDGWFSITPENICPYIRIDGDRWPWEIAGVDDDIEPAVIEDMRRYWDV